MQFGSSDSITLAASVFKFGKAVYPLNLILYEHIVSDSFNASTYKRFWPHWFLSNLKLAL